MMDVTWRLLDLRAHNPFMNMAIDEALLKACIRQKTATIRFYTWSRPAVSIGCLQKIAKNFDQAQSQQLGLTAVRRPSGGRMVLHKGDLTYAVVFAEDNPVIPQGIMASYQKLSQAIQWGLTSLGIPVQVCQTRKINRSTFCFSVATKYETLVQGKKIIGNAQKRERGAVLQQGSIMMQNNKKLIYQLFMRSGKPEAGEKFTSVEEALGGPVSVSLVKDALIRGFEKVLNISLVSGSLTDWEKQEAIRLCREKYSLDCWNKEGHL